jgi:Ser/Thr protein kinase RdoA (MazF antagonist)
MNFETLTPDAVLTAVEQASGFHLTNLTAGLPSYINRVYELLAKDGTRLIVKFYRPGRWTHEAIEDEHRFVSDCMQAEIPVVAPLGLAGEETIAEYEGMFFALYPKRAGRQLEITDDSLWPRLGSLIGRMHVCGEKRSAQHRVTIDPGKSAANDLAYLCDRVIPPRFAPAFNDTVQKILSLSAPLFDAANTIRVHGDCHRGNILDRLEQGLQLIDFDDMAMGPPVQDLWLLLPDRADKSQREIDLFLSGYERFRRFNRQSLKCIEPLRAMRMVYFLAWCSKQAGDFAF